VVLVENVSEGGKGNHHLLAAFRREHRVRVFFKKMQYSTNIYARYTLNAELIYIPFSHLVYKNTFIPFIASLRGFSNVSGFVRG
jgi:hypothetical protein